MNGKSQKLTGLFFLNSILTLSWDNHVTSIIIFVMLHYVNSANKCDHWLASDNQLWFSCSVWGLPWFCGKWSGSI